ncbi:hypothetical protein TNCV_1664961 [Trichonephila clavipes]|uniref:Uncharacterized protein n=1 Tax=Trichonephila clavipes TaxID=2585209 RepID=A0A8X6V0Z4_TRICX|nr:hypothetical protein TNCV_1664961 [Trichonephila clavipes]
MHLWINFTPNASVLFVDVALQPEVRFTAKQNSLMKIGNNGNLVLGPFYESTPRLMIVLMNCQTKLRIIHLTAVKSVAIWKGVEEHVQCRLLFSLFQEFTEVINSIVVAKIPNPTDISLVWVPF